MAGAARNRTGIQYAALRAKLDDIFEDEHDALELAYYQFWRHGQSRPWHGFDVRASVAQSKAQFDRLHGGLFHLYTIALHKLNSVDVDGGHILDAQALQASRDWIAAQGVNVSAIRNYLVNRLLERGWNVDLS